MNQEFTDNPSFVPWGPFISPNYKSEPITKGDVVVASTVWGLTLVNVLVAIYQAWKQSRVSRSPLRSVYVWMIWLELVVSFVMGLECWLHILKVIPPSKLAWHIRWRIRTDSEKVFSFTSLFVSTVSGRAGGCEFGFVSTADRCSVLVVYPGPAPPSNHHQPYPYHCAGPQVLETYHDWHGHFRHCNQHQCIQHLGSGSSADQPQVRCLLRQEVKRADHGQIPHNQ
jgi:hypothetical protein